MNTNQLKNYLFAGALLVMGVVYGYFFNSVLSGGAIGYPLVFAALFTASMLMSAILIKDKKILSLAFAASFIGVSLMSIRVFSIQYIIAIFVSLIVLIFAGLRAGKIAESSLKFDLGKIARAFVPLAVTSLAILASVIYTSSFISTEFIISDESFRGLVTPFEYLAKGYIPNFSLDMTVPEVIRATIDAHPPAELKGVSKDAKDKFLRESEGQMISAISATLQVSVSREDSVLGALNRAANSNVKKIPDDFRIAALIAFGFLIFLSIKGFGFIFYFPVLFLAWLIYRSLLAAGFARVIEEDAKREILTI